MSCGCRPVETLLDHGINIGTYWHYQIIASLAHKEQEEQHRGEGEFQFFLFLFFSGILSYLA